MSIECSAKQKLKATSTVLTLELHPATKSLLLGSLDGGIEFYKQKSPVLGAEAEVVFNYELVGKTQAKENDVSCREVCYSPKGNKVYCAYSDKTIEIFDEDISIPKVLGRLMSEESPSCLLPYEEDIFVVGDNEGSVSIFDTRVNSKGCLDSVKEHSECITDMKVSKKYHLCCTSDDGILSIVDLRKFKTKKTIQKYKTSIQEECGFNCMQLVQNEKSLLVGSDEGVLYSFASSQVFQKSESSEERDYDTDEFNFSNKILGHPESIDQLAKVDEDTLLTASFDGFLRLVNVNSGQMICAFDVSKDHKNMPVEVMKLSFDNSLVATASHDNIVRLFDFSQFLQEDNNATEETEPTSKKQKTDFLSDM